MKGDSGSLKKSLSGLSSVSRVQVLEQNDEGVQLRAYPENGQPVIQEVLNLAAKENWQIAQIRQEEGRLDEVFRSLTVTDDVSSETQEEA